MSNENKMKDFNKRSLGEIAKLSTKNIFYNFSRGIWFKLAKDGVKHPLTRHDIHMALMPKKKRHGHLTKARENAENMKKDKELLEKVKANENTDMDMGNDKGSID